MKIGIVTFHRALNYGAVLQAYALQKFLDSLNIDSCVVDYRSAYMEHFYKPVKANPVKDPLKFAKELLYFKKNKEKRKNFDLFIEQYIKTTGPIRSYSELEDLNEHFDLFLAGSDQVWNWRWSGFDRTYFLDFADISKRYSYAASFGFDMVQENQQETYATLLNTFQALSVREKTGVEIIKKVTGRRAINHVDPTLLLSNEDWNSLAETPGEKGYVLLYTLEKSEELENLAAQLAEERHVQVIRIVDAIRKVDKYVCRGFMSPAEFVGLFANASCIVTNSYHGLMFSCIFEKEFHLAYQKEKNAPNSRLMDFVTEYGLETRVFGTSSYAPEKAVDYHKIQERLQDRRDESRNYLQGICGFRTGVTGSMSRSHCCGCRACELICSKHAIHFEPDKEGFLYPYVDSELCIQCGRCVSVCAFSQFQGSVTARPLQTLIAKHQADEIRERSRSGGAFVAISDQVLGMGGVVYGVSLDKNFQAAHARAETREERNMFCGSKYVQSDTGHTFAQVIQDLRDGRTVLFSGTGCQVDGLKHYLSMHERDGYTGQLLTCDIICHGVMSPLVWENNLSYIRSKYGDNLQAVNFRDKRYGWDSHVESYTYIDYICRSDVYSSVFYENVALRPSCYGCPYTSLQRTADITLADAWGLKRNYAQWDDNRGVSLIFLNTQAGIQLFESAAHLKYTEVPLDDFMQPNMQHPTARPAGRGDFWDSLFQNGFETAALSSVKSQKKLKRRNQLKGTAVRFFRKLGIKK